MEPRNNDELIAQIDCGRPFKYLYFWGCEQETKLPTKVCLSQWYKSPFQCGEKIFYTAEHYMMYRKALLFNDAKVASKILGNPKPGAAKALGRQISGFDERIWFDKRYEIVVEGSYLKFTQNTMLRSFLLNTKKRILVEASPIDRIWGIGFSEDQVESADPKKWRGSNFLGYALMEARAQIQRESEKK